jgi:hypothetical protein
VKKVQERRVFRHTRDFELFETTQLSGLFQQPANIPQGIEFALAREFIPGRLLLKHAREHALAGAGSVHADISLRGVIGGFWNES